MRPLYLDAGRTAAVALDGPALAVRGRSRATGRFPLRMLSRVLVCGSMQWDTQALVECLRRGIPVCFSDSDGVLVGVCLGMRAEGIPLHERIAEFALRPDWPRHYALWFAAAERRAVLAALRSLSMRVPDLRAAPARAALDARLAEVGGPLAARRASAFLESAAVACAARVLHDSGLSCALLIDDRDGHNLARDLGRLLVWDTRALACELLARGVSADRRSLAAAYHEREPRQWSLAHDYLALLERRAVELAYGEL